MMIWSFASSLKQSQKAKVKQDHNYKQHGTHAQNANISEDERSENTYLFNV
jgi:hypothetical protein